MRVREATTADGPAIRRLFNALIPTTTIAWRDDPMKPEEMAAWFDEQQLAGRPVLVAERDGAVVGYTTWSTFRGGPRLPGYQHTVELTIHVDGEVHRQGVGRMLLSALMDAARAADLHVMVAGIDSDNTPSIELHRAMGFTEVARMPEVGRKHGRWLDLVLMQHILS